MILILQVTAALWILHYVLIPNLVTVFKEFRNERRRRAVRRELDRADVAGYRDPAWPRVSAGRPPVRDAAVTRDRATLARVLAMRSSQPGVVLVDGPDPAHVSRVLAYRRELAAEGKELNDLRIEG